MLGKDKELFLLIPDNIRGVEHRKKFSEFGFTMVAKAHGQSMEPPNFVPLVFNLLRIISENLTENSLVDRFALLLVALLVLSDITGIGRVDSNAEKALPFRGGLRLIT